MIGETWFSSISCISVSAAFLLLSEVSFGSDWIKVPVAEKRVAGVPAAPEPRGTLPRPLLLVDLHEMGEDFDDPDATSYWVFDPAKPADGLRMIFKGPGQNQYLWLRTPIYQGYALATGHLDSKKEPKEDKTSFWFNVLNGKKGSTVDVNIHEQYKQNDWIIGEERSQGDGKNTIMRIVKYQPVKGLVEVSQMAFSYLNWLEKNSVLGVSRIEGKECVVLFNVEKSCYKVMGTVPPDFNSRANRFFRYSINLAGKEGKDGIYAVSAFTLSYQPKEGKWRTVLSEVPIVKTFGGAPPWLPVAYVGKSRFAISKTTKREVKVPEGFDKIFGAAEGVTMLVDGITGKHLRQTEPFIYHHNPPLKIPPDWWVGGLQPEPSAWEKLRQRSDEKEAISLFQVDEKKRAISFAGDQILRLTADSKYLPSGDGRYMLIYEDWAHRKKGAHAVVRIRVADGVTGKIYESNVKSSFNRVCLEACWHELRSR